MIPNRYDVLAVRWFLLTVVAAILSIPVAVYASLSGVAWGDCAAVVFGLVMLTCIGMTLANILRADRLQRRR